MSIQPAIPLRIVTAALLLLAAAMFLSEAGLNMRKGGPAASRGRSEKPAPVKSDLPYIACHVCEQVVGQIHSAVTDERAKNSKGKIEESRILEIIDAVCKQDLPSGQWIRQIDIVETKKDGASRLTLTSPGGMSKCGEECATVEKSCTDFLDEDIDRDELSALIWKKSPSLEILQEKACVKMTKRCSSKGKAKYLPAKFKRIDFPFEVISEKDLQMEQLMAQMKESGMGGMKAYNREDMAAMAGLGDDEDYDEDNYEPEEESDASSPFDRSNLATNAALGGDEGEF